MEISNSPLLEDIEIGRVLERTTIRTLTLIPVEPTEPLVDSWIVVSNHLQIRPENCIISAKTSASIAHNKLLGYIIRWIESDNRDVEPDVSVGNPFAE